MAHEATQLAQLAGKLAAAVSVSDVLEILVEVGPDPVGATATEAAALPMTPRARRPAIASPRLSGGTAHAR